jgi:RNA polymerase sigma factor (TIGR02999 family)
MLAGRGVFMVKPSSEVSRMPNAIAEGNLKAAVEVLPLVYDGLRRLAAHKLAHEKPGQSLDATDLVNEAYLHLVGRADQARWHNHRHFFAAAATAMRRILVEQTRRRKRRKYGGGLRRVDLTDEAIASTQPPEELLAVHEALDRLAAEDATAAELVKRRYYAGLSIQEAGEALGPSRAEAYRQWSYARPWLRNALAGGSGDPVG